MAKWSCDEGAVHVLGEVEKRRERREEGGSDRKFDAEQRMRSERVFGIEYVYILHKNTIFHVCVTVAVIHYEGL